MIIDLYEQKKREFSWLENGSKLNRRGHTYIYECMHTYKLSTLREFATASERLKGECINAYAKRKIKKNVNKKCQAI